MTDLELAPLVIVAVAVGVAVAHRRLLKAAQPMRLELAEKGERLLAYPKLPKDVRDHVRYLLDTAFGNRTMLILAALFAPLIVLAIAIMRESFLAYIKQFSIMDAEAKALHREVMQLHDRIMLASHPILWVLVELEIKLVVQMGIVVTTLVRGRVPATVDHDRVMNLIETREGKFFWHSKKLAA